MLAFTGDCAGLDYQTLLAPGTWASTASTMVVARARGAVRVMAFAVTDPLHATIGQVGRSRGRWPGVACAWADVFAEGDGVGLAAAHSVGDAWVSTTRACGQRPLAAGSSVSVVAGLPISAGFDASDVPGLVGSGTSQFGHAGIVVERSPGTAVLVVSSIPPPGLGARLVAGGPLRTTPMAGTLNPWSRRI